MKPAIHKISKQGDQLFFTLSNVDVSIANAIRRTILSDIPTVVFRSTPHDENGCNVLVNTTRLNDQIIQQRLSAIPVHVKNIDKFPWKNLQIEVNVENITDSIIFVTTEDFKIKNKTDGKFLSESQVKEIFPPNAYTAHFIDFVRLRPKLTEEIKGDKIHVTADFSIGTAKENGLFNVVSTCSYAFTPNETKINSELAKKKQQLKDDGKSEHEIEYEIKNWLLLDAKRIYEENSFDFVIQSVGVFDNEDLVTKACSILCEKLKVLDTLIEDDKLKIEGSKTTMENSFDVILENEDYSTGKALEYILYHKFFENDKTLTFIGFSKMHPHDKQSVLRMAFVSAADSSIIKKLLKEGIVDLIDIFEGISTRISRQ